MSESKSQSAAMQAFERRLHPATEMGMVALAVADLERSLAYYQDRIGLRLKRRENGTAYLGAGGDGAVLLKLVEQPGARPVQAGRTGLYHFAILTPSRYELSRVLNHLVETRTPIGGASDHAVSEALYLTDPDGHGIEIYRDRPRAEWPNLNGRINMTLDPFDAQGVLAELAKKPAAWEGMHRDTKIGHVHLHVADIATAEKFYVDTLGFDLILRYGGSASFISAGGYHHHLGLNIWAGQGAPPPPDDACRLLYYVVQMPDQPSLEAVRQRLQTAQIAYEEVETGLRVADPFRNMIHLHIHA